MLIGKPQSTAKVGESINVLLSSGKMVKAEVLSPVTTKFCMVFYDNKTWYALGESSIEKREKQQYKKVNNEKIKPVNSYIKCLFYDNSKLFIGADRKPVNVYEIESGVLQYIGLTSLKNKSYQGAIAISETNNDRWVLLPSQTIINADHLGLNSFSYGQLKWVGILQGVIFKSFVKTGIVTQGASYQEYVYEAFNEASWYPDHCKLFTTFTMTNPNITFFVNNSYVNYGQIVCGLQPLPIPLQHYPFYSISGYNDRLNVPTLGGSQLLYYHLYLSLDEDVTASAAGRIFGNNIRTTDGIQERFTSGSLFYDLIYSCPNDIDYVYTITENNYSETHTVTGTNNYNAPDDIYYEFAGNGDYYGNYSYLGSSNGEREYNTERSYNRTAKSVYNDQLITGDLIETSVTSHYYAHFISLSSNLYVEYTQAINFFSYKNSALNNASVDISRYGTHPVSYERYHDNVSVKITDNYSETWSLSDSYNVTFNLSLELIDLQFTANTWGGGEQTRITYRHNVYYEITRNLVENKPIILISNGKYAIYETKQKLISYTLDYSTTQNNQYRGNPVLSLQGIGFPAAVNWQNAGQVVPNYSDQFRPLLNGRLSLDGGVTGTLQRTQILSTTNYTPNQTYLLNQFYLRDDVANILYQLDTNAIYCECNNIEISNFPQTLTVGVGYALIGKHNYRYYSSFTSNNLQITDEIPLYSMPTVNTFTPVGDLIYDLAWDNIIGQEINLCQREAQGYFIYSGTITNYSYNDSSPNEVTTRFLSTLTINFTEKKKVKFFGGEHFVVLDSASVLWTKNNANNLIRYFLNKENATKKISIGKQGTIYILQSISDPAKKNSSHYLDIYQLQDNKYQRVNNAITTQLALGEDIDDYNSIGFGG